MMFPSALLTSISIVIPQMETLLWVVLLVASAGAKASPSRDLAEDADKFLLPWNIRPEHYDLTIYTHIENFQDQVEESFEFMGVSEITFNVLYGDVADLVLHTYDTISIVSAQIISLDGGKIKFDAFLRLT